MCIYSCEIKKYAYDINYVISKWANKCINKLICLYK